MAVQNMSREVRWDFISTHSGKCSLWSLGGRSHTQLRDFHCLGSHTKGKWWCWCGWRPHSLESHL